MNTIYFDKNIKEWNIFEQQEDTFFLLKKFQHGEDKACTAFLENLSPAKIFCVENSNNFSFWQNIQKSHNPIEWIQKTQIGSSICYTADHRLILTLSALAVPKIRERNYQEGVTLVFEENKEFFSILTYKNQIFGAFEHNIQNLDTALLKKNFEEFRFGWLPDEEVRKQNGKGCILKNISADAEGFRPTFIFCSHKDFFAGMGRFMDLEISPKTNIALLNSVLYEQKLF